jgi:catechol 2,3-dioxygenase-like lactoylglutathione lyase family enzyme
MRWTIFTLSLCAAAAAFLLPAQTNAPNPSGISFGHIHLYSPEPARVEKLLVDVLGGTSQKIGTLQTVKTPGVYFIISQRAENAGGTDGSAVNHVGFLVKSYAAVKAKAEAAGLPIRELTPNIQAFITFPGDVLIEVQEDTTIAQNTIFSHYHLSAADTNAAREWYLKTFGAVESERRKGSKGAGFTGGGNVDFLGFGGAGKNKAPATPPAALAATKGRSLDHIGFEVKGLKDFVAKLEASGIKMDRPYTEMKAKIGVDLAFFTDPNGTYIELTEGLAGN